MICARPAFTRSALDARAQACSAVINSGAAGDALASALRNRGEVSRVLGAYADALADFNRAIALDPDSVHGFNGRGATYLEMGERAKALADFETALRLAPGDGLGYANRGAVELRSSQLDAAIHDFDRAIELDPNYANAWADRGLAFLAKHEPDLALADFSDALKANPNLGFALNGAGDASRTKGDVAGAVAAYQRAEGAYHNAGFYARALGEAEKMVALKPDDPDLLNARCWERAIVGKDLPGALADCQRSLAIKPNAAEVLDSLAFVKFQMGRYAEAIRAYDAALAQNPKLPSSLYMRGVAKQRAGDADGGQADIDAAKQIDAGVQDEFTGYGVTPQP